MPIRYLFSLILLSSITLSLSAQSIDLTGRWISSDGRTYFDFDKDKTNLLVVDFSLSKRFLAEYEFDGDSVLKLKKENGDLFHFNFQSISDNRVQLTEENLGDELTLLRILNDKLELSDLNLNIRSTPIKFYESLICLSGNNQCYELDAENQTYRNAKVELVDDEYVNYFLIDEIYKMHILNFDGQSITILTGGVVLPNYVNKHMSNSSLDKSLIGSYEIPKQYDFQNEVVVILKKNYKAIKIESVLTHDGHRRRKYKSKWYAHSGLNILEIKNQHSSDFYQVIKQEDEYILVPFVDEHIQKQLLNRVPRSHGSGHNK